jgi:MFS transporter, OFA family, oxalate/formate antiporter
LLSSSSFCRDLFEKEFYVVKQQNKRLIKPEKLPFYYGWLLVPVATIGTILSIPGQTAGFSAFTEPLLLVTGITRTKLSMAYFIGTMASGLVLPYFGKLIDRLGSRLIMTAACFLLAISLSLFSIIDRIAAKINAILPFLATPILFLVLLIFGIFCLRFFGQGLLPLCSNTMIGKWFERKRGRAVAIMSFANSLAFASAPAVMNLLVSSKGWRGAWFFTAGILTVMACLVWLFYRNTPESCGLQIDGKGERYDRKTQEIILENISGFSLNEALRMLPFWVIVMVLSINAMVNTGVTFHINEIGMQAGIGPQRAAAIFIPVSLITIPLSISAALFSNRIPPFVYVTVMAFGEILAFISLSFLDTTVGYVCAIIGMGMSTGLMGPIISTVIPKIFGRLHLGAINGTMTSIMVMSSAIGPLILSYINDAIGTFAWGVRVSAFLPIIVLLMMIRSLRNPLFSQISG